MPTLTIVTPTYNRANRLKKCYQSLCEQTLKDFQWLIIDDGSNDETAKLIEEIGDENNLFGIDYYKKENGGKHTALNYAHQYIKGEYVLVLDSDDYLCLEAVEKILLYWCKYDTNEKISIISFRKKDTKGYIVGNEERCEEFQGNHIKYRINSNKQGDQCEVFRRELLKKFPFPVFENEKFLGEDYLWVHAAHEFDTVYINQAIYVCEYLEDGLSKSGRRMRIQNPNGGMVHGGLYLSEKFSLKYRIKGMILYIAYALFAKKNVVNLFLKMEYKEIFLFVLPFGCALYLFWKWRYS